MNAAERAAQRFYWAEEHILLFRAVNSPEYRIFRDIEFVELDVEIDDPNWGPVEGI